jgi:hypothetical protein
MGFTRVANGRFSTVVAAAAVLALAGAGAGYAAGKVGSSGILNGSIRSVDIKNGTVKTKDLSAKTIAQLQGADGAPGQNAPQPEAAYQGANWSVVDPTTIKNGDSFLRPGPSFINRFAETVDPPLGVGSLGMRTGDSGDRATFGNQVDYEGVPLSAINSVSYSIYISSFNSADDPSNENGPTFQFEIDPNHPGGLAFATLTYQPTGLRPDLGQAWFEQNATTAERWWYNGDQNGDMTAGTPGEVSGCTPANYCTLAEAKAAFPNATITTVQISKGPDREYSGAVDALRINNLMFDFEPTGVLASSVS